MNFPVQLVCKTHQLPLTAAGSSFICSQGCRYEVVNNIPRFVPTQNYASSFGVQWNVFRTTQLDSCTGLTISRDRLARIAGGSLNIFQGKKILEVGCGAGRFTELILQSGGYVFAVDLSTAVDANYQNCSAFERYSVAQADVMGLPVLPEQFDIVVCIGVVQHTPDPEATIKVLCAHVRPGGVLLMDHYSQDYPATRVRRWIRSFLLGKDEEYSMRFVQRLVRLLWPIHQLVYKWRNKKMGRRLVTPLLHLSPVVDYHYVYTQLDEQRLYEWAILDTHDTLTDRYKHLRSAEEIRSILTLSGMDKIETVYAGNGVEVRARKPGS